MIFHPDRRRAAVVIPIHQVLVLMICLVSWNGMAHAFIVDPSHSTRIAKKGRGVHGRSGHMHLLLSAVVDSDDDGRGSSITLRRLDPIGVSVSKDGFLALLSTSIPSNKGADEHSRVVLPIRITTDPIDEVAASSVEALTFIQLLGYDIDMGAAAVLPPRLLQDLVALHCTHNNEAVQDEGCSIIQEVLVRDLPNGVSFYEANPWQRSRVKFPNIILNGVRLELPVSVAADFDNGEESLLACNGETLPVIPFRFLLECSVDGKPLETCLFSEDEELSDKELKNKSEPLQATSYHYGPASAAFTAISLSFRYKCPISISLSSLIDAQKLHPTSFITCEDADFEASVNDVLPKWKSADDLRGQTERIDKNLMSGFEANKLEGALKIALEKGDEVAAQKIREKLEKYDSFEDLPTTVDYDEGSFQ